MKENANSTANPKGSKTHSFGGANSPMPEIVTEGQVHVALSQDAFGSNYWRYVAINGEWNYDGNFNTEEAAAKHVSSKVKQAQAANEHAALLAVAEAAKLFKNSVEAYTVNKNHLPGEIARNYISAGLKLNSALASLAAVQKGGAQ